MRHWTPRIRRGAAVLFGLLMVALVGQAQAVDSPPQSPAALRARQIADSLERAATFLTDRQSSDGAWRSDVYPPFRDGDALTPVVLESLLCQPLSAKLEAACRRATAYLEAPIQADGTISVGPHGLSYPVYTAAASVVALSDVHNGRRSRARDAWLQYLRDRQLTESLGWRSEDSVYGGWCYSPDLPRKPQTGEATPALSEPNLSATAFAIDALRVAGCGPEDPAVKKAMSFVNRCQNYHERNAPVADLAFDDGGFFFMLEDAVRNKAGVAGRDSTGRERFNSYGSATADGLRALLKCGQPSESLRVVATRRWLDSHFSADSHPGNYAKDREHAREAPYYYYARSQVLAWQVLCRANASTVRPTATQAISLADALLARQEADGSWRNKAVDLREDDPLVATSAAVQALVACRDLADLQDAKPTK
jgi:squalene-hopene/tetraprenyl-beta-curcumene cyclase